MKNIDDVLAALEGVKGGGGNWVAKCPAHEDKSPSLSISIGNNGKPLLKCHAGCSSDAVIEAIGFKWSDFHDSDDVTSARKPRTVAKAPGPKIYKTFGDVLNAATYFTLRDHPDAVITQYTYGPAYVRVRLDWIEENGEAGKTFRETSRQEGGSWLMRKPKGATPLYRASQIDRKGTTTAYVCEGEKAVDAGWGIGLQCTTSGSSSSAAHGDWASLEGLKQVVILPDNDEPGKKYADEVARHLSAIDHPPAIKIVWLPVVGRGDDLADWVETAQETHDSLADAVAAFNALIEAAPVLSKPGAKSSAKASAAATAASFSAHATAPLERQTDLGNAELFSRWFGNDVRHSPGSGWLSYREARWHAEDDAAVFRMAMRTIANMRDLANEEESSATQFILLQHVRRSESSRSIKAIPEIAKSFRGIAIDDSDLDRDDWVFNVKNGTIQIDGKTGENVLREHRRDDLITQISMVEYASAARCPRFEAFLGQIFQGDEAMISFAQRALGSCLLGVPEEVLHVWYGQGSNGKSTLIDAICEVFADYATTLPQRFLASKPWEGGTFDTMELRGARIGIVHESEARMVLDEAKVKYLTGRDKIKARTLYKPFVQFRPTHKIILVTNHKPIVQSQTKAIWRRIKLWPFLWQVPEDEIDRTMGDSLIAEASGILNWLLAGVRDWVVRGRDCSPPSAIEDATMDYRQSEDVLGEWIGERITDDRPVGCGVATDGRNLYDNYLDWARSIGQEKTFSTRRFYSLLEERGFRPAKARGVRTFHGIWVRPGLLPGMGASETDKEAASAIASMGTDNAPQGRIPF